MNENKNLLEQRLHSLHLEVEQLKQKVDQLSQMIQTNLPTSAQEQFAQNMQARTQQPDQNIEQYAGR